MALIPCVGVIMGMYAFYAYAIVPMQLLHSSEKAISDLLDAAIISSCVLEIALIDMETRRMPEMTLEERQEWENLLRKYGLPRSILTCSIDRFKRKVHPGLKSDLTFTTTQLSEEKLRLTLDVLDKSMEKMGVVFQPIVEYFN